MSTQKEIKQKISSTKSINKITQAMQLVATAKSQKSLRELQDYKGYYLKLKSIMATINSVLNTKDDYKGTYWIVVTSDLGLAGGYNAAVIRAARSSLQSGDKIFVIGNKGKSLEGTNQESVDTFYKDPEESLDKINEIVDECFEENLKLKIIYTQYISQLEYSPKLFSLIPAEFDEDEEVEVSKNMEFEPSAERLMKEITPLYISGILQGIYKETQAAEHTARRVAMENATRNSDEMLKELEIKYNRTRQSKITQEISEIIGGAESLK